MTKEKAIDASYMCRLLKAQIAKEVREAMTPPKLSLWEEEKEGPTNEVEAQDRE